MWFLFQQPDDFLERFHAERVRDERHARLLRDLRGSTVAVDAPAERRHEMAFADPCRGSLAVERS